MYQPYPVTSPRLPCIRCSAQIPLDKFAMNGVGRRMKICQSCYAGLFEAGARWPRNREFEERLGEIQALAREGLRRLKRPKIVSVGKVRYGAYERRHR